MAKPTPAPKRYRLSTGDKSMLRGHVAQTIHPSTAVRDAARDALVAALDLPGRFPAEDMKVLAKYHAASLATYIHLAPDSSSYQRTVNLAKPVLLPNRTGIQLKAEDKAAREAAYAYLNAVEAWDEAFTALKDDYYQLIRASMYLDEIVAIWPEAAKVVQPTAPAKPQLPSSLSAEAADRIKADVARRMREAEAAKK